MSYRFMRILVMFDLPVETTEQKREYRRFRNYLIKNGFLMLQESIYSKLALNQTVAESVAKSVRKNKPKEGLVQMLVITEKQFSRMELISGKYTSDVLDSDERLIVI